MPSNTGAPSLKQQLMGMLEPGQLMLWSLSRKFNSEQASYDYLGFATDYLRVCKEAVINGEIFAPIFQISKLRDVAFGRFWVEFSSNRPSELTGSSALIPPLLSTSTGIVLDIGPGAGSQMHLLRSKEITSIYGPEPCTTLHPTLRTTAINEGISEKYHILPSGVSAKDLLPALRKTGTGVTDAYEKDTKNGIFDTILCVRVLCSVPELEKTTKELYALLKPGGRLLVTEHVVNRPFDGNGKGSVIGRLTQFIWMWVGWKFLLGDCCLDRDTEGALRGAAGVEGWESFDIERSAEWSAMPYISGTLVKKSL
ncbi:hypothetical protein N7478_007705 [Penicillium angulare]|uniref:uncharacterized protein n=1 Tax=Penicillium angulare TaxID=116970 RepID=UPI002541B597|nr:uncharacterized protein N7478_007705 [Penicillium angulare]KAJ5272580.1 hypothetical protein N7478_007705 [Penicillium angulare]